LLGVLLVAFFSVFLFASFGKPFNFVGTWKGLKSLKSVPAAPGADPAVIQSLREIQVKIDNRGWFTMTIGSIDYSGNAAYSGHTVELSPLKIMGVVLERQTEQVKASVPIATLVPQKNGTVTFTIKGEEPVVLTRDAGETATGGTSHP